MRGVIRSLNCEKGFGFIHSTAAAKTPDGDWFFHCSAVVLPQTFDDLHEKDNVEFEPVPDSPKGPRAEQVRLLEG